MAPVGGSGTFWQRRGIRTRATVAAVLVVGLALGVGGVLLVSLLRVTLVATVDQAVQQRANDLATQISADDLEAARPTVASGPDDRTVLQVVDPAGTVLLASPSIQGEPALASPVAVGTTSTDQLVPGFASGQSPYAVASVAVGTPGGPLTVFAAQSLAEIDRLTRTVALLLAVAAPLLLGAVGLVTWFAVGRSLHAVDRIRRRVETIEASDLHARVPVPPSGDEVARLAQTMNEMLGRLDDSAARQRQFIADAGHEIRSPLASMRTSVDVAAAAATLEAWTDSARVLNDEIGRMSRLVEDLLLLAKADDRALPLRVEDVDLDDLVSEEASRLRAQGTRDVTTAVEPVRVQGDRARLAQALRNLVDNAARYSRRTIRLTLGLRDGLAVLAVADDGPGIPAAQRDAVKLRFVRLDDHRGRDHGGSGLGLAIASEIARAHDGTLRIGDADMGGAEVRLELPVDPAALHSGNGSTNR